MTSFKFNTKAVSIGELPLDKEQLIKDADELIDGIVKTWKKNKTYNFKLSNGIKESVTTYGKTIDNEYWLARVSEHENNKHEDFLKYLIGEEDENKKGDVKDLYNHSTHEPGYIAVLDKWEKIPLESFDGYDDINDKEKLHKNWVSLKAFYELGAPLTTREFNEFLFASVKGNTGWVIQVVAEKALESNNVRGIYVSLERVRLLDNGSTEWAMCTASDSGGNVPKWLQNTMISKAVSSDVPSFLNWLQSKN